MDETAKKIYVVGTFDTKGRELLFIKECVEKAGLPVVTVDLSTATAVAKALLADVGPSSVASFHPKGKEAVFTNERGTAVTEMSLAFKCFVLNCKDLGGMISAGGSGGTALVSPAMRALPVGMPRMLVSTMASGNVAPYVGPSDICMMYSITDVQGLNRISERVLSNAAHAIAGMLRFRHEVSVAAKPPIGLSMFGVTTPCVQAVQKELDHSYDCLIFHATGTGGQSMEKLVDSKMLVGVLDITTTEVCDYLFDGVLSAGQDRLGAIIRTKLPYVGSCGALDMVNFGAKETVPARYKNRKLYVHNSNVTLMRTTPEENAQMGKWIAERLNRMEGPVRFLIPEKGVSLLDSAGADFWDPEADAALFAALKKNFVASDNRKLISLPHNLNDVQFSSALVENFNDIIV